MPNRATDKGQLVNEHEAARILAIEVATLRRWRWSGQGPCFYKIGAAVRYRADDLAEFIQRARRHSTSDLGELGSSSER